METSEKIIYEDEFDKIWDYIIQTLILDYAKKYGLKYKRSLKNKLKKRFNRQRAIFINSFMAVHACDIDRHKIASCIIKAILIVKPFYIPLSKKLKFIFTKHELYELFDVQSQYSGNPDINQYIYYANEYLALSVALTILDGYIDADDDKEMKHKITLPDPFAADAPDYLLNICIDLHFNKLKSINIVTFANVFFLWEKYSCRRAQCENLKEECERLLLQSGECTKDELGAKIDSIRFKPRND